MADFLEEIVQKTRERIEAQKKQRPLEELRQQTGERKKTVPFAQALRRADGIAVIAELKQASPSAGLIREEHDVAGRIRGYVRGGAAAISILTEEYYFHGSPYILELAKKVTSVPVLRKDFIIDPYQVEESRLMGADALLLITTLLPRPLLKDLLDQTHQAGMEALVETHDEAELKLALEVGATVIGVNHRNLRTLQMDMTIAERLLPLIPREHKTIVVESGIAHPEQAAHFRALGAHAVLIGEALMRDPNPTVIVRSFVQGGRDTNKESHD